jgi:hypothetical protein
MGVWMTWLKRHMDVYNLVWKKSELLSIISGIEAEY